MNAIITKHNLDFESADWPRNPAIKVFRVGTCEGQWIATDMAFCIMSVINSKPGNGHLEDVFEWFEYACKTQGKALMILEFFNDRFKKHCIDKRGFTSIPGKNDVIKIF